jgi:hypothetical protein
MKRWSFLVGTGALLLLVGGAVAALVLLVRHEPDFYRKAAIPPGPQRQQQASKFQTEFFHLINNQVIHSEPKWGAEVTEEQINSYFQEDFSRPGTADRVLPTGSSDPRVQIEPGKLRVGLRYGSGLWQTIVSVELQVWVAGKEPNVIVAEVLRLRAGALPISSQSLLDRLAEAARARRIDVTWYRHHGNPVAVLRLATDQPRTSARLQSLELQQGKLAISGCTEPSP